MTPADSPSLELDPQAERAGATSNWPRWTLLDIGLLTIVLIVAAVFRFSGLDRPMSYDELWHLGLSTGRGSPIGQIEPDRVYLDPPRQTSLVGAPPFYRVWSGMDGVLHPPLYVITLRLWRDAFGPSDFAAISYSIGLSFVALAFCYATVRLITDPIASALITLAMAVARSQVYFSQAVRGYEMLIALGAIAVWIMACIEFRGVTRGRVVALAAMTLPLLLTHYFSAGAVAAMCVYGLWRSGRERVAFVAALAVAAAIYAIIWLPFALRQLTALSTGDAFLKVESVSLLNEAIAIFGVPLRLIVDALQTTYLAGAIGAALLVVSIFTGRTRNARGMLPALLWIGCSVGVIAFLDVARTTRHALFIRYFAIATPGVFMLFAVLAAALPRRLHLVAACSLLIAAAVIRPPGKPVLFDSPGFTRIAQYLSLEAPRDDALLLFRSGGPAEYPDNVYIHCSAEPYLFPRPVVKVTKPLSSELMATLPRRAWLVVPFPDPELLGRTFPGVQILSRFDVPSEGTIYHLELPGKNAS